MKSLILSLTFTFLAPSFSYAETDSGANAPRDYSAQGDLSHGNFPAEKTAAGQCTDCNRHSTNVDRNADTTYNASKIPDNSNKDNSQAQ